LPEVDIQSAAGIALGVVISTVAGTAEARGVGNIWRNWSRWRYPKNAETQIGIKRGVAGAILVCSECMPEKQNSHRQSVGGCFVVIENIWDIYF
jgi:hypothetical protein